MLEIQYVLILIRRIIKKKQQYLHLAHFRHASLSLHINTFIAVFGKEVLQLLVSSCEQNPIYFDQIAKNESDNH